MRKMLLFATGILVTGSALGQNVGIGVSSPSAKLSISSIGSELVGTATSTSLKTNAGNLGSMPGDEMSLANFGFITPNNSSLGIRAIRKVSGVGWEGTAIVLGMDVDNTVRASQAYLTLNGVGNVGINTTSPEASAALEVSSTSKGFLPPRITMSNRNNIVTPVEGLTIWCTNCGVYGQLQVFNGAFWTNMVGEGPLGTPTVGMVDGGGTVGYIFQPEDLGYIAGETHGLVVSSANLFSGEWGCMGTIIGGTSTAIGTGLMNTNAIVAGCGSSMIAAKKCESLVSNGYDDWYLPSKNDLNKLYMNAYVIGGYTYNPYWTSSEGDANTAWSQSFLNGVQAVEDKTFSFGHIVLSDLFNDF